MGQLNYKFCKQNGAVAPADSQDGFGMVFRKTIDCGKDNLATSTNYAIARLPKGFAPRIACVYVDEAIADASLNVTVGIGTDADFDANGVTGNLAVYSTGSVAGATLGTSASASDSAVTLTQAILSDGDRYLSFAVGTAVSKGKLTITLCGDQLVTPAKAL